MNNTDDHFIINKPVIGVVQLDALPGTELYNSNQGIYKIVEKAKADYETLLAGGIDAVIFCNEYDKPYLKHVGPHTVSVLTMIINKVIQKKLVPFGVDIQWDPQAALAVALATDASFVRGILVGAYCGDLGLYETDIEALLAYRRKIGAQHVKLFANLVPEFSYSLDNRPLALRAKTVSKSALIDGICVSGIMAGINAELDQLKEVKQAVGDFTVIANTGVNVENIGDILNIVDGCFVATSVKVEGEADKKVDLQKVKNLMKAKREKN